MVLTGLSFFHKKYAIEFYSEKFKKDVQHVMAVGNCEDILMNFVIAGASQKPPVYLNGKIISVSKSGISTHPMHMSRRNECMNLFSKDTGIELISTNINY